MLFFSITHRYTHTWIISRLYVGGGASGFKAGMLLLVISNACVLLNIVCVVDVSGGTLTCILRNGVVEFDLINLLKVFLTLFLQVLRCKYSLLDFYCFGVALICGLIDFGEL